MIRKKQKPKEIIIDLTGPEGNAFALIGYAQNFAEQLGIDPKPIISDMMKGNYEHLLDVFEKNFGSFVILER